MGTALKALLAVVVCVVLTGAGCATAPPSGVVEETPVIKLGPGDHSSTIAFQRVQLQIPAGQVIGEQFADYICAVGDHPLYVNKGYRDLQPQEYRQLFATELTQAGYSVAGESSLFKESDAATPDLIVAGAIVGINLNVCIAATVMGPDQLNADLTLSIEWQVYDPLERRVVFKTVTRGRGKAQATLDAVQPQALRIAFTDAARNLLGNRDFYTLATHHGEDTQPPSASAQPPSATLKSPPAPVTINQSPLSTTSFQQRVEKIRPQVVTIFTGRGSGSGFFIADGLLLTNQHVTGDAETVRIRLLSGAEVHGHVESTNARRDVALIRTEPLGLSGLPVRADEPGVGTQVFVIGTPLDPKLEDTVSSGIVSAFRSIGGERFIQSDAAIQHGNSGGPMLDDKGNVIGITKSMRVEEHGVNANINFFIPIGEALDSVGVTLQATAPGKAPKVEIKHSASP